MRNRKFSPAECLKICEDAVEAGKKALKDAHLTPGQEARANTAITHILQMVMANLMLGTEILGNNLIEEAQIGVAIGEVVSSVMKNYQSGIEACREKGGTPACA
jgi:hypothetical protein